MKIGENSFDVIRGLRIILECSHYPIRPEHRDGEIVFKDGKSHYFRIINSLCIPGDVKELFNVHGIGLVIAKQFSAESCKFYGDRNGFLT
ncbi:hypothetical protein [Streptomyces sp. CHB9.2]|uniref:hypothetical protein n=1 Tax=Streptomyces sp. CHB9.2 TaxID=2841670 RepID=UPI002095B792|nr:hypothetical protein [Streptomyces sp. CHB9.2]MCO6704778.1 hypothetical protein [Streptomyces sp. CHB9.2]